MWVGEEEGEVGMVGVSVGRGIGRSMAAAK